MDFFNIGKVRELRRQLDRRLRENAHDKEENATIVRDVREDCDRMIRETEHKLGLERKRHEFELEEAAVHGAQEASIKLEVAKDRHIETMLTTINKHHNEIISRLPTVHVDRQIANGRKRT